MISLSGENLVGNYFGGRFAGNRYGDCHAGNHSEGHRIGGHSQKSAAPQPQPAFSRILVPKRGSGRSIHPPIRNPAQDRRAEPSPSVRACRNRYRLICQAPPKQSPPEEPFLTMLFSSACSLRYTRRQGACQMATRVFRVACDANA